MKGRRKPSAQAVNWERVIGIAGAVIAILALIAALEANRLSNESNRIADETKRIAETQVVSKLKISVISPFTVGFSLDNGRVICRRKIRITNSGASPALITRFDAAVWNNHFEITIDSESAWGEAFAIRKNFKPMPFTYGDTYLLRGKLDAIVGLSDEDLRKNLVDFPIRIEPSDSIDIWTETRLDLEKKDVADKRFGVTTSIDSGGYAYTSDKSHDVSPIAVDHEFGLSDGGVIETNKLNCGYLPIYPYREHLK